MGGRYRMDANLEEKVPEFNNKFGALAKLWTDPVEPQKIRRSMLSAYHQQVPRNLANHSLLQTMKMLATPNTGRDANYTSQILPCHCHWWYSSTAVASWQVN